MFLVSLLEKDADDLLRLCVQQGVSQAIDVLNNLLTKLQLLVTGRR